MIDTSILRKKLLNLAVRGLICEQQDSDTPVLSELEKYEPKMEIDLPEIPDEWKYCKFDDVLVNRDSERIPVSVADRKKLDKIYNYYGASGVIDKVDQFLFDEKLLLISEDGANLLSRSTPIAFLAEGKFWVNNHAHVLAATENILLEYAELAINAMSLVPFVTGAAQPKLSQNMMNKIAIPVPPIEEQERIVEKIREAFKILSVIDELQVNYLADIEVLKSKLIEAGIRGKLTEQLSGDGTAERLDDVEHVDLITDEDKILDIPDNWSWIRLGWAVEIERGGSPRPIKAFITDRETGINWIKIGDVEKDGKYIFRTKEKIKPEGANKSRKVYPGDFLLTNSMSYGRPYISKIEGCIHDGWLLLRNSKELFNLDYLYWLLSSKYVYNQFCKKASGATVDNLNKEKVASAVIPLPPINEQKRIVHRIEELLQTIQTRGVLWLTRS